MMYVTIMIAIKRWKGKQASGRGHSHACYLCCSSGLAWCKEQCDVLRNAGFATDNLACEQCMLYKHAASFRDAANAIPVNSPMGTSIMSTMRGSTMSSLMSLSSQVRHSTDQFTCTGLHLSDGCQCTSHWLPLKVQGYKACLSGTEAPSFRMIIGLASCDVQSKGSNT